MAQTNSLYQHTVLGYQCTTTQVKGGWVEFFIDPDTGLRWLEEPIFLQVHKFLHVLPLSPEGQYNLNAMRDNAQAQGILIPKEILAKP